ncbi:MAG: PD-(D/E)XK nuclease domain-containing protein [Bacteroides sp.]|nr:PD-(D/E)XK nuclease domain-containing protein [Phocaeicola vulgatus]MDU7570736.1 PD-(D/E)XK nuclease domain-containing protein [Bacteroides sp.]
MHKGETKLTIPNQVVCEQLFAYILDTYHENDLTFDRYEKRKLVSGLAYDGKWKPYFEYIAGCLHRYASQQDKQKGEYFVHGFTLAITAQNPFYRPVSEKDSQEGYVNLFLHPLLDIYKDISHSYIIELKYAKGKDSSERIEQLRRQAIEQAERYASSESVQKAIGPTMLHKIIIVYRGMEMVVCEEL